MARKKSTAAKSSIRRRTGAEICSELLEIPPDVETALLFQSYVEVLIDVTEAIKSGEAGQEMPPHLLGRFCGLEAAFNREPGEGLQGLADRTAAVYLLWRPSSVVTHCYGRVDTLTTLLPASQQLRRFKTAFNRWRKNWYDDDVPPLEDATARLVTP